MLGALFMLVVGVDRQWQFAITYSNGQPVETSRVLGGVRGEGGKRAPVRCDL
jgi:hypothetical protein